MITEHILSDSRNTLELINGLFILTTKDQIKYNFDSNGYLTGMTDRNGNTVAIEVDANGKVQRITDQVQRQVTIDYEEGRINRISDSNGRHIDYLYENGKLVKVVDPMGNSVHYTYDQEGYLNGILDNESNILESITYNHAEGEDQHKVYSKTDIYGNVFTYSYDNINKKVTITDSNGKTNVKWYDDSMFIIQDSDPEGKLTITEYFTDANVKNNYGEEKSVTDRNGNKTQYQRDGNGNITKITNPDSSTQVFTYDSKNNLLSEKDETGKSVYYVYDASQKNLIKEVRPYNGTDVYTQGGDESKFAITSYEYYTDEESQQLSFNALGILKSITDPEGNTVYYSYDPSGNLSTITDPQGNSTENTYNGFGLVTKTVTPEGYATTSVYDLNGRLEKQVLDGGETTRILYDPEGRKVKEVSPKLYSSALDDIANHNYTGDHGDRYTYYENGKISTFTDSENRVTSYDYDLYGNLLSETKPDGTIYSYEYDSINRPVKVWFQENESAQPVLLEEYIYEILSDKKTKRNVIQYLDSSNFTKTEYTYDYADRLLIQKNNDNSTLQTSYFANGQVNTTTDANGNVITYIYDGLNRLIEKRTPFEKIGSTTYFTIQKYTYDANGNVLEEKITRNVPGQTEVYTTKKYSYDSLNRLVMVTQIDNGSPVNYVQYYYDADGNQVRMYTGLSIPLTINGLDNVTPGGDQDFSVTRYSYNHIGKLVGYTDPLGNSETYEYDSNGNLISQTDRNGNVLTYTYDNLNRMLTKNVTSSDSSKNVSYTYAYDIGGNLESEAGGYTDVEYDYDPMGRLITETEASGVIKEYSYDLAGNRTSFKLLVDGVLKTDLSYTYDNMQRLYEVKENGTATATYLYDINGNRLSLTYVNGNSTTYSYNLANKLKVLTNKQNGTDISKYTYSYTLDGNQVSKKDLANITTSYSYDDLGRLTSETREGITTAYQYDDYNNRESMEITGGLDDVLTEYVYDDNNRLITEIKTIDGVSETTTYSYDDNGNQIGKGSSAYKYDGLNRLIEAVEGGQTYNYTYYSYDLRATKSVGGSTTVHIWDGQEIAGELDGNGVLINRYIRGINLIAADDGSAQNRKYYLYNGHSDVVQLTGTSGNVIKTYDYDAFGNELNPDPNDTNVFRYSGEYFDKETGKIYLRARYYDPAIGRFISEDSVWGKSNDPLSLNLYTYAYNNPVLYSDPSGHIANFVAGALIGAGIGLGITAVTDYLDDGEFNKDWKEYAGAAASGAIVGATAGLTAGFSTAAAIGAGAAGGFLGNAAEQEITTGKFDISQAAISTAAGGAGAGLGKVLGPALNKLVSKAGKGLSSLWGKISKGTGNTKPGSYAPNRELPRTKYGDPIPDTDAPHTQLGQRTDNGITYNQGRTWETNPNGKGVTATKDYDFSDHGMPQNHPNPHQHTLTPANPRLAPKGGYHRGPAEPLP